MITEAHGIPLAVSLTGGNRNDVTLSLPKTSSVQLRRLCDTR